MRIHLASFVLVTGTAACASPSPAPVMVQGAQSPSAPSTPARPPIAAPSAVAPTTFRPSVDDVQVLVDGDTLVLPMRSYHGPRTTAPLPSTVAALRGFGVDLVEDQWVLADGAAPCLAHPSAVVLDVAEPLACSAVDCDLDFAHVTLAGCAPGVVAIAGRPAGGDSPAPTWRYVAATTTTGSDLVHEDRSTAAYQRKLERYHRAYGRAAVHNPGFVHRARPRTALPDRFRWLAPRCGRRCALTWTVNHLPIAPAIEALTIERATGAADSLCHLAFETEVHLFAIAPGGPVPLDADAQPALARLERGFRGALVEGDVIQLALPAGGPEPADCDSVEH